MEEGSDLVDKKNVKRKDKTYYFIEGFFTKKLVEPLLPYWIGYTN